MGESSTSFKTREITPTEVDISTSRKPLVEKETLAHQAFYWGGMLLFFLGLTLGVYLIYAYVAFDWQANGFSFFPTVMSIDPQSVGNAVGTYIQLLGAILGIMITVVAIVLQLAAERYGTRLVDLFLADKINRAYFILMVCSVLYSVLIIFTVKNDFYPRMAIDGLLLIILVELGLMGPYFLFVFKFLTAANLLSSIQFNSKSSVEKATNRSNFPYLKKFQDDVSTALDQMTDSALSASSQMDRNLGLMAINQIREILLDYLELKNKLPRTWFQVTQDKFIGITSELYNEYCDNKLWVEAKAFMDMDLIYRSCIGSMSDALSAITLNTRIIGEKAIENNDDELLELVVRYYNTFIRVSINEVNWRSIFNLLYQYRLLTEKVFDYDIKLSERILSHFLYYGEICLDRGQGLEFVHYTAAFDLGGLVATAYDKKLANIQDLLKIFMALEDKVEKTKDPAIYTGVRQAQLILAAYLLSKGDSQLLPIVVEDLKSDTLKQLVAWRDGLLAIKDRKYWEITDRGYLFQYIDEEQKKYLRLFYQKYVLSQPDFFHK